LIHNYNEILNSMKLFHSIIDMLHILVLINVLYGVDYLYLYSNVFSGSLVVRKKTHLYNFFLINTVTLIL